MRLVDSGTGVGDLEHGASGAPADGNRDPAASSGHGVARVDHQVHPHLLELVGVDLDRPQRRLQALDDLDGTVGVGPPLGELAHLVVVELVVVRVEDE